MKSKEKALDDLKALGSIGDKRQAFIREKLNVRTYQDMVDLSEEKIRAAFKDEGKPISQKIIQQWLVVAQEKIQEGADNWEWLDKIFVVEFRVFKQNDEVNGRQSRIYHIKVGKNGDWLENGEKIPIEKEGRELYPWMLEQLGEQLQSWESEKEIVSEISTSTARPVEKAAATETYPIISRLEKIEINEIRIFHLLDSDAPIGVGKNGTPFRRLIQSEQPFSFEVVFDLPELANIKTRPDLTYRVNFYVRNRDQKDCVSIGETKPVKITAGKVAYVAQLPNIVLPIGNYDLGAIVYIQSQPPSANYIEVSQFRVV